MVKELQLCTKTRLPSLTQHTMIVVWLGDSVNEYRAKYLQLLDQVTLRCPICSSECGSHGWYSRKVRLEEEATRIPVLRVRCRGCNLLFAPLGRELGGFSEWIFEVDPFIIAGELEQPQNIRWDIVRQMALYMVIIGQIDNLNRVEHIQQYTGCWAV